MWLLEVLDHLGRPLGGAHTLTLEPSKFKIEIVNGGFAKSLRVSHSFAIPTRSVRPGDTLILQNPKVSAQ